MPQVAMLSGHFNSQPHEEADCPSSSYYSVYMHFNSQPHEEADNGGHTMGAHTSISTHSLTKRLT